MQSFKLCWPRFNRAAIIKNNHSLMIVQNFCQIYFLDSFLFTAQTVRSGGNALVPCYPSGVVYDLFECLSNHLDNLGLSLIPMYFVSPMAESSLAYSNIFSEWWVKRSEKDLCGLAVVVFDISGCSHMIWFL